MKKLLPIFFFPVLFFWQNQSFGSPIFNSQAYLEKKQLWLDFRNQFKYHIQLVGLKTYTDNSLNIIISEPPNRVKFEDIQRKLAGLNYSSEVKEWKIGVDGWVKDVVISATDLSDFQLRNLLAELNELLFYTAYKADYLDLEILPKLSSIKNKSNYQVSAAELNKWFLTDKELFFPVDNRDQKLNISTILSKKMYGEFYSVRTGFVLWVLPSNQDISTMAKIIRRFALDTDLLIGAISNNYSLAIIGRERKESVYISPPLRTESVLMLAAANKTQLAQSYERNSLFAGKLSSLRDWAPIYLSDELINTEYGSLLNITDQMLKSWSQNGEVKYQNFDYPNPKNWAFKRPVFDELRATSLIYNWNTKGVGYSINLGDLQVYAVNRTGSLPVTYMPDSTNANSTVMSFEERGYDFFSGLNDPNLIKVGQYAFLYQIFCAYNIRAGKIFLNKIEPVNDVLSLPAARLFKGIVKKDLSKSIELLYGTEFGEKYNLLYKNLKKFYEMYGEEGLLEIARAANDRNELYKIDKTYSLINKLRYEEQETALLHDLYVGPHNKVAAEFNLYAGRYLTGAEQIKADALKAQLKLYRGLMDPLKADVLRIRARIKSLEYVADQKLSIKFQILGNINFIKDLVTISSLQRDSIGKAYSQAWSQANRNDTWIKTPSVVVSYNTHDYLMTGGHNIDPTIEKFVLDNTVPRSQIKVTSQFGKRVLRINPADLHLINSRFLGNMRYVDNQLNSTATVKIIEKGFNNSGNTEIREIKNVFVVDQRVDRGYVAQQQIGWTYDESPVSGKTMSIRKTDDGFYMINNRKSATCYNLRESIEEHLQKNPGADAVVEFNNFSETEVKYFSENIASRFMRKNSNSRWRVFRTEKEPITSVNYDFTKKEIKQLDNGIIQIIVPKKKLVGSAFIKIVSAAKIVYKTASARIEKVFKAGMADPTHDIPSKLLDEFKAAGIPIEKIIVSADDCTICITLKHPDACRS